MPKLRPLAQSRPDLTQCCAPLAAEPLSGDQAVVLAERLKAIADPARLRLLSLLLAAEDGEACTCELTDPLGLSQPTVSHHLKKLLDAGLVTADRRGVWTYYAARPDALRAIAEVLAEPASAPQPSRRPTATLRNPRR